MFVPSNYARVRHAVEVFRESDLRVDLGHHNADRLRVEQGVPLRVLISSNVRSLGRGILLWSTEDWAKLVMDYDFGADYTAVRLNV